MSDKLLHILYTPDGFRLDICPELDEKNQQLRTALEQNPWMAIYSLGFEESAGLSPSLAYLQEISRTFSDQLAARPELEIAREKTEVPLEEETPGLLLQKAPFVPGSEFINPDWLKRIWQHLQDAFRQDAAEWKGSMKQYLTSRNSSIQTAERIYFHLVENRADPSFPFAFLATYAAKTQEGTIRHLPLSHALKEYDSADPRLLKMLSCLSRVCEVSPLMDEFITSGEIFHPLSLSAREAWEFLKSIEEIEKAGIGCRIPNWWKRHSSSVSLSVAMGSKKESLLGLTSLISLTPSLTVDGVKLTKKEIQELLKMDEGLFLLKGKWVEVDHEKLHDLLEKMEEYGGDISLLEGLRMQNGLTSRQEEDVQITNGRWLNTLMNHLRSPDTIRSRAVPASVHADLRPYQKSGVAWLSVMHDTGLGACLADDMGLGKTLQVLAFLEKMRTVSPDSRNLLVAPASLLENWKKEAEKFTPELPVKILHGRSAAKLEEELEEPAFLTITTYGMASRLEGLKNREWEYVIADEAQALKNPRTKQTRSLKAIPAKHRIALTGTPIENDLSNLWSLFDFLDKGLLGTSKEFSAYAKNLQEHPENYARLKNMIAPFMLRRLKTDRSILPDLPEKIEKTEFVSLSRKQTALYHQQVKNLENLLEKEDSELSGIQRKGAVLAAISKFKQICNHPDQFLDQKTFKPEESGKFEVLKDICETILEKRESVLVFTQYREIIPELDRYLTEIFGCPGMTIHGGTTVKKRQELVDAFNAQETYIPYMILSLKAAGTGLNLTRASHVIHFDRWWNPAVENQATDRAYRIGQNQNVVVHKLVCSGTIEEKIDQMIESKKELARKVVGADSESWITELSNEELLNMVRLDV